MTPTLLDLVCARCGCADILAYAEEHPICPHCGTVLGVTPPPQDHRAFLDHFPAPRRSAIANWFHFAVREGAQTPHAVCRAVEQRVQGRLDWCSRPETQTHLHRLLEVMRTDQAGTLAYAQYVIEYEQLPYAARQKIKGRRALTFVMQGKEPTLPQLAYLRSLGYQGPPPLDRAQASLLIDQLRQQQGGAR